MGPPMSVPPNHDQPIRLEPIEDPPPKVQEEVSEWIPATEPLILAPETPTTSDPVLDDLEQFRVPNSTNYRCAHCNYILAGLTSRRCPECGEPFTIDSAQMHGREPAPDMVNLISAVRRDTIKFYSGVGLLVAGFMIPNIAGGAFRTSGPMSFRGLVMLIIIFPAMMFTAYFRQSGDFKWCDLLLFAGLIIALFGTLLAVL
jgi:hypothetical protein